MKPFIPCGDMMQNFYAAEFHRSAAERRAVLKRIRNRADAEAYVRETRRKLAACFGPFPAPAELASQTGARHRLGGIAVETIRFESRPHFTVTGLLFLPRATGKPAPAVLGLCGHAEDGKHCPTYQTFAVNLAAKGFAVLLVDPVGQGERKQYPDSPEHVPFCRDCCFEHNMLGKLLLLNGDFFGSWRLYDAMRALDYLATREEVDAERIFVTGNSGGGTLSSYLFAFDRRVKAAAIGCYLTTFRHNFDNELPVDAEQTPPGIVAARLDMADFLLVRAPAPVLILGQSNDIFDPRGTREVYEETRQFYRHYDAEAEVRLQVAIGDHGYSPANRQAMYGFFTQLAFGGSDEAETISDVLPLEATFAAPGGSVRNLPGEKTIPDFCRESIRTKKLSATEISRWLRETLGIAPVTEVPGYRVLRTRYHGGINNVSVFAVATEPGIQAFLHYLAPDCYFHLPDGNECTLYLADRDAETELLNNMPSLAVAAAENDNHDGMRFALDVRGIGKSMPLTGAKDEDFLHPYGTDYFFAAAGQMTSKPYPGGKIHDVLAVLALLNANGMKSITLTGYGMGARLALLVKAVSPSVEIRLPEAVVPYGELVAKKSFHLPQSLLIPGILQHFDLNDIPLAAVKS